MSIGSLARFPSEKSGTMILVTGEMGQKGGKTRGFIEMQELRRYIRLHTTVGLEYSGG